MKTFLLVTILVTLLAAFSQCNRSLLYPSWKHCVHRLQSKRAWQEFVSPGYPHGISTQTQCSWIISAPSSQRIKIAFQTLNLTGGINNCFTQFIEFWEIKTASSMGKFCGGRKPGDYVSYGSQLRIDLRADTAAAGHKGFMIKYRTSGEAGGFKETHSFSTNPSSGTKKRKPSTSIKATIFPKNGGRVNLNQRLKQRQRPSKPKPVTENMRIRASPNQQVRYFQRNSVSNRSPTPDNEIKITLKNGNGANELELWIIIVIAVGGFVFLVLLGVVSWLCLCKKKKKKIPTNPIECKSPLDTQGYPIYSKHDLPGLTAPCQNYGHHPVTQKLVFENGRLFDQMPARRAPKTEHISEKSTDKFSKSIDNISRKTKSDKKFNNINSDVTNCGEKNNSPFIVGSPSRCASNVTLASLETSVEQTKRINLKGEKIPTLKRKLSEWEKTEMKRKNRMLR